MGRSGVGQAVDKFGENIVGVVQQDVGGRFRGPEVLPSPEHGVMVFGEEAMEFSGKRDDVVFGVVDTGVVMVAHGDGPQDLDAGFLGGNSQAIEEGLIGSLGGAQEELTLGATTAEEPNAALGNVARLGHERGIRPVRLGVA